MIVLSNNQRKYFGLDPIMKNWEKVIFKGDGSRPDSVLYYEGNTIRKQIISSEYEYKEFQLNEQTDHREFLLPKTKKGKPKKLSPSTLESRKRIGVYLVLNSTGTLKIGNFTTQTTFYSRNWEHRSFKGDLATLINEFIDHSEEDHFDKIDAFRNAKRKRINYKTGDFFAFKLNRKEFGFGRILFDVNKARKKNLIKEDHGLNLLMGPALLIKLYAFKSDHIDIDVSLLKNQKSLPSDYIMDNVIFYGDYQIIGNLPLEMNEFDFPISYGRRIDQTPNVFLQWGLIHKELPISKFNKYITGINEKLPESNLSRYKQNPYSYYAIGFTPTMERLDILETINNQGKFDFSKAQHYKLEWDLRNPKNKKILKDIMKAFGLKRKKNYQDNCIMTGTNNILELIDEMK